MSIAAIILAGGRGSRLGGVRKADLVVDGRRLLDRVLDAVADCAPRVVVGFADLEVPQGVLLTREDPPGSGPAAAVAAGMTLIENQSPEWVLTLACDLPGVAHAVPGLVAATRSAPDEVDTFYALTPRQDGDQSTTDRVEWLISIHRTASLARVIAQRGEAGVNNCSMRRLFTPLRGEQVTAPPGSTDDIDTWEDHEKWQKKVGQT